MIILQNMKQPFSIRSRKTGVKIMQAIPWLTPLRAGFSPLSKRERESAQFNNDNNNDNKKQ